MYARFTKAWIRVFVNLASCLLLLIVPSSCLPRPHQITCTHKNKKERSLNVHDWFIYSFVMKSSTSLSWCFWQIWPGWIHNNVKNRGHGTQIALWLLSIINYVGNQELKTTQILTRITKSSDPHYNRYGNQTQSGSGRQEAEDTQPWKRSLEPVMIWWKYSWVIFKHLSSF